MSKEKVRKERKEIKKINLIMKVLLKKMYKKYGYVNSLKAINSMQQANDNEKLLLKEYIQDLNIYELNNR